MNAQSLRAALADALSRDPAVHLLGEAVELSPATAGLRAAHPERVHLLPAADASLIGVAVGLALGGARPVVELAGGEAAWGALQQLGQEAAAFSKDSDFPVPVVVRVPVNPGLADPSALLASVPGLTVVVASSSAEAVALLRAALTARGPVVIIEPGQAMSRSDAAESLPLGVARTLRPGSHASALTWGDGVNVCLDAAEALASEGISLEVLDLRCLSPLDLSAIGESVNRTGRPIVVGDSTAPLLAAVGASFLRLESPPVSSAPTRAAVLDAVRGAVSY